MIEKSTIEKSIQISHTKRAGAGGEPRHGTARHDGELIAAATGFHKGMLLLLLASGCALALATRAAQATQPPEEVIVTSRLVEEPAFSTPYTVDIITERRILQANLRSTPDIFREIPGTLVQKTAYGHGSPYIRGFTGFRNLFMIDGIRLNNAVFREGPNQYWATVDAGTFGRMEVVRGPKSTLYGSDAIGGTVNALTRSPIAYRENDGLRGGLHVRYGEAEDSAVIGGTVDVPMGSSTGLLLGGSAKDFNDIESGASKLPNTGYEEWTFDGKLRHELSDSLQLTLAHSEVHQDDVPRTHRTIFAVPYAGTTVGDELRRDLDQDRALTYVRLQGADTGGVSAWQTTVFRHSQEEERQRLRSADRFDEQRVKVDTTGVNFSATAGTDHFGQFTLGMDLAHDDVNSFSSSNPIQGPVADNSTYDWFGVFLQNTYGLSETLELTTGARLAHMAVDAGSISDPVDGSEYSYKQEWSEPVGNLRLSWEPLPGQAMLYTGISKGFRAPNLSDLTRLDSARSNEFEIPATNLDPEEYFQYEVGGRYSGDKVRLNASVYYTDIQGQIQRLLTGEVNANGEFELTKANIGDGDLYGVEVEGSYHFTKRLHAFGHFAWLDGKISNQTEVGQPTVDDNHSRMMPASYRAGLHYRVEMQTPWWVEAEMFHADKADDLSLRDMSDTQRIPPGGTPAYTVWNLRGGLQVGPALELNFAVENLLDDNYRVHGSGQNEPGRNLIVSADYRF